MPIKELEAALFEALAHAQDGDPEASRFALRCFHEFLSRVDAFLSRELTIAEAARYSGVSPYQIGRLIAQGKLPTTAASEDTPRVRVFDLPMNAPDRERILRTLRSLKRAMASELDQPNAT
ncbi:MAG: hypothetical protein GTO46_04970 [Gemmatimonadetes bacterium]|nr:hypothetical protein [Gemmatimonadota bacterium]NIO30838.1 hypothetical protein [Gemmatimonadota bacterium]